MSTSAPLFVTYSRVNQWQICCAFVETVHLWRPKRCVVDLQMLGHKSWSYACPWTDFQRFGVIVDLWASPVIAGNWALVAGLEQDVVAKPLGFDLRPALH